MSVFVGASSAEFTNAGSVALAKPSGVTPGDLLVAQVCGPTDTNTPAGWTLLAEQGAASTGRQRVYYRMVGESEPASWTWTFGNNTGTATLAAYRGVNTSAPIRASVGNYAYGGGSNDPTMPSVTAQAGDTLMLLVGSEEPGAVDPMSAPAGMTSRTSRTFVTGGSEYDSLVADETRASAGATGTRTVAVGDDFLMWWVTGVVVAGNRPPNAPAWTTPNDQTTPADQDFTLAWAFSDPDTGDSQSAFNLNRWTLDGSGSRVGAPVLVYSETPTSQYKIPGGTLTAGTSYEFQVSTFDSFGKEGPAAPSLFLTAGATPDGPVWVSPTNGQTIGSATFEGVISAPSVDESEWTLYADNAGAINEAVVLQGPVSVTTGDLRRHTFTGLANNTSVWWSVRVKSAGLWSTPTRIRTPVSFTPPPTPSLVVALAPEQGAQTVAITNPAPVAGVPAAIYNDVYVRTAESSSAVDSFRPFSENGVRLAAMKPLNSSLIDWAPASGVVYEYRVASVADNGTVAYSPWTAVDPIAEPTIYYGGAY